MQVVESRPVVHEGSLEPHIVAVIPAYNEERFIASVVLTARSYVDRVIVVDDGSTDRTALLARAAGAEVIQLLENGGKGSALNAGFTRARELCPTAVVVLDGDAQHDPAEIPRLIQPLLAGTADVVIGSRFLDTASEIPAWRRMGQRTLNLLTNATSRVTTSDSQSGYRALAPHALDTLWFHGNSQWFESQGLATESEMQFLLHDTSLRVAEVPISVQYRDGNKRNPVAHGIQVIEAILSLVTHQRPLLFLTLPGVIMVLMGFTVGLSAVFILEGRHVLPVGTVIVSSLLIITGVSMMMTGLTLNTFEHFVTRVRLEIHDVILQLTRDEKWRDRDNSGP